MHTHFSAYSSFALSVHAAVLKKNSLDWGCHRAASQIKDNLHILVLNTQQQKQPV